MDNVRGRAKFPVRLSRVQEKREQKKRVQAG